EPRVVLPAPDGPPGIPLGRPAAEKAVVGVSGLAVLVEAEEGAVVHAATLALTRGADLAGFAPLVAQDVASGVGLWYATHNVRRQGYPDSFLPAKPRGSTPGALAFTGDVKLR